MRGFEFFQKSIFDRLFVLNISTVLKLIFIVSREDDSLSYLLPRIELPGLLIDYFFNFNRRKIGREEDFNCFLIKTIFCIKSPKKSGRELILFP